MLSDNHHQILMQFEYNESLELKDINGNIEDINELADNGFFYKETLQNGHYIYIKTLKCSEYIAEYKNKQLENKKLNKQFRISTFISIASFAIAIASFIVAIIALKH